MVLSSAPTASRTLSRDTGGRPGAKALPTSTTSTRCLVGTMIGRRSQAPAFVIVPMDVGRRRRLLLLGERELRTQLHTKVALHTTVRAHASSLGRQRSDATGNRQVEWTSIERVVVHADSDARSERDLASISGDEEIDVTRLLLVPVAVELDVEDLRPELELQGLPSMSNTAAYRVRIVPSSRLALADLAHDVEVVLPAEQALLARRAVEVDRILGL
jgi:hypothetical protein